MTREAFSNFVYAAEHSANLRRELKKCIDNDALLSLAANYGFYITAKDLEEDHLADKMKGWFDSSKISPIKKSSN